MDASPASSTQTLSSQSPCSSRSSLSSLSTQSSQSLPPPPPQTPCSQPPPPHHISIIKLSLLALFTIGAFVAWYLGAWEMILVRTGIRPRSRAVLLLVGDSLTEKGKIPSSLGWITMLESDCRRSVDVVSRGLAGYNTRWYLKYAMPVIHDEITTGSYTPALVTIWLGANDAVLPNGSMAEQHVPIEAYQRNLAELVHTFQAIAPHSGLLLITPPHVDDTVQQTNAMNNEGAIKGVVSRSNAMTGKYAHACVDVANKLNIPVLDLYTFFNNMPVWERNDMLEDGLHFNATGNGVVYQEFREIIDAEFPAVSRMLNQWQIPRYEDWVEIDPWPPEDSTSLDFTSVRRRN
ncbi:unnamed protein product [Phytophthora lilii]|uniref:Unnamed protein product n=1 Tax=Phytophthora lilii TaxID=2077276 RepID=A0A9W6YD93_9STRA|nr:unnamed protein product [Phytophthora lilii]